MQVIESKAEAGWETAMVGLFFTLVTTVEDGTALSVGQSLFCPAYRCLNAAQLALKGGAKYVQLNTIGKDATEAIVWSYSAPSDSEEENTNPTEPSKKEEDNEQAQ